MAEQPISKITLELQIPKRVPRIPIKVIPTVTKINSADKEVRTLIDIAIPTMEE